jgi:hypothetical protein
MSDKGKSGYVGNIKNQGSQVVKAPNQTTPGSKTGKVKTGNDLRQGTGGSTKNK